MLNVSVFIRLAWERLIITLLHGWKIRIWDETQPRPDGTLIAHWGKPATSPACIFPVELLERTQKVWSKKFGRPVSQDEALRILADWGGFFNLLRKVREASREK